MPDIADQADVQVAAAIAAALAVRKPAGPKAVGRCLYCCSGLPHGVRWCDSGCREDWEAEQEATKRGFGVIAPRDEFGQMAGEYRRAVVQHLHEQDRLRAELLALKTVAAEMDAALATCQISMGYRNFSAPLVLAAREKYEALKC